jgi:folate-binding protein YgfZ
MMAEKPYYTTLKNRGSVTVSGPDRRAFLQGLISNDIDLLDSQPCIYACLLNAQGKFLHDFFITENNGIITLECEGGERAKDLHKKLSMYKLRANVKIDHQENIAVYSILLPFTQASSRRKPGSSSTGQEDPGFRRDDDCRFYPDPRHQQLGYRSFKKPPGEELNFEEWDRLRISLTIPDGSRDLIVGNSTLDEGRIDKLNGVSYEKGCYIGQELTARMHYRSLGKKHLCTVKIDQLPDGAELRSHCGDIGLALLKG